MKKLLALLLTLLMGISLMPMAGFAVTHFTETLPPAVSQGCVPISNGYDWGLSCDSPAQPTTFNGTNAGPSIFTVQQATQLSSFSVVVPTSKYILLCSSGLNITPNGAGSNNSGPISTATAKAGQEIVLISSASGTTANCSVTLTSGAASGLDLGSATRVLNYGKALGLYFNSLQSQWVEEFYGNN